MAPHGVASRTHSEVTDKYLQCFKYPLSPMPKLKSTTRTNLLYGNAESSALSNVEPA